MAVTLTTVCRRFHFLPLQLILPVIVILSFIAFKVFSSPEEEKVQWSDVRLEELKKYNMNEVDLNFLRKAGFVDHKIQELTDEDINAMNETELMVAVHSYLDNAEIVCKRRVRMGALSDDAWDVCDDENVRPKVPPCLVYSFNHRDSPAFEYDVSRVYKCEVHSFQPYYTGKEYNRSDNTIVHPFGIGRYSEITPEGNELYTMSDIRTVLEHTNRNIDLIKMNIDGTEWSVLYGMLNNDELDNVKQLLVEYHVAPPPNEERLRRIIKVLSNLSEVGFRKFYVHKNPRGSFHHPNFPVMIPKSYQIHYLNSRFVKKPGKKEKE
uniref:Methyltransferase domain-containing protein n=1 Tax=Arion vulgaris TaxID=1028688 RepID=A0A0B7B897_9EUPU